MKNKLFAVMLILSVSSVMTAAEADDNSAIVERIRKAGSVCIKGEVCPPGKGEAEEIANVITESAADEGEAAGEIQVTKEMPSAEEKQVAETVQAETIEKVTTSGRPPASLYNTSCAICHGAGISGAPVAFDPQSWSQRLAKGMPALYKSAIEGFQPSMPAKGMCFDCTDDELRSLVDYMLGEK